MVSIQPRKQRKALYNAPHHQARKQMASHLSEELLQKYDRRSMTLVVGDEVSIMRGDFAGNKGKVMAVDVKARTVHVEGVINKKADGTEVPRGIAPSNLKIITLNLEDQRRRDALDNRSEAVKMGKAPSKGPKTAGKPAAAAPKAGKSAKKEA
jgi:large subunit ribosomal protein L24